MLRRSTILFALIITIQGCIEEEINRPICSTKHRYGIVVDVRDYCCPTGLAEDAVGWIQDGSYIDTLQLYEIGGVDYWGNYISLCGAYERPGTYSITIKRNGYIDYHCDNIVVKHNKCNVITEYLRVEMAKKIDVEVVLNPDTIHVDGKTDINIKVTNNTSDRFGFIYQYDCLFRYSAYNNAGCLFIYPTICSFGFATLVLDPDESVEGVLVLNNIYKKLEPGTYRIEAGLFGCYSSNATLVVID